MALNWNLDRIQDYKKLCWLPELKEDGSPRRAPDGEALVRLNPITDNLIWNAHNIGIPAITEKNAEEFHDRMETLFIYDACATLGYYKSDEAKQPSSRISTLEEVRQHIGLSTNSSRITPAAFKRKVKKLAKEADQEVCARGFEEPDPENMSLVTA